MNGKKFGEGLIVTAWICGLAVSGVVLFAHFVMSMPWANVFP